MNKTLGKRKLSCIRGYKEIKKMDIDTSGVLREFIDEGMALFGVQNRNSLERKMTCADLNQAEVNAFNELFTKYGVTINVWEEVE